MKQPHGPPMTLGNLRSMGVRGLAVCCLNPNCRHQERLDVTAYSDQTAVPWFQLLARCRNCGGRNVDVRPNWKEQPPTESLTGKQWR